MLEKNKQYRRRAFRNEQEIENDKMENYYDVYDTNNESKSSDTDNEQQNILNTDMQRVKEDKIYIEFRQ